MGGMGAPEVLVMYGREVLRKVRYMNCSNVDHVQEKCAPP